ncbi:MAG: hypothetical protein AUK34_08375 [Ignavibacteria bacterium CG2_30_36_16]|jgi:hypothetical protein|nr:DUF2281 domain-containing protein [Ignavibacteria bacterium]OIP58920.1 MAG: hypothetical protein AUK34_08375 [Ignavibacteria bacterium CG2_30_36_16]PJB00852.1 MAG: DUF2281 domain-containing protein [Ignavibacteria bacterium CG_4_9_14_3_um_filter_36_18]
MENEGFYNKFESLPIEAQKQVLTFIDFLQKRYESKSKKLREWKPIKDKKFVGIWENREDVNDSSLWIRNLRKKEWREIGE